MVSTRILKLVQTVGLSTRSRKTRGRGRIGSLLVLERAGQEEVDALGDVVHRLVALRDEDAADGVVQPNDVGRRRALGAGEGDVDAARHELVLERGDRCRLCSDSTLC